MTHVKQIIKNVALPSHPSPAYEKVVAGDEILGVGMLDGQLVASVLFGAGNHHWTFRVVVDTGKVPPAPFLPFTSVYDYDTVYHVFMVE